MALSYFYDISAHFYSYLISPIGSHLRLGAVPIFIQRQQKGCTLRCLYYHSIEMCHQRGSLFHVKNHTALVHEGESFYCRYCPSTSIFHSEDGHIPSIFKHMKRHHPSELMDQVFECLMCSKTFNKLQKLHCHIFKVHVSKIYGDSISTKQRSRQSLKNNDVYGSWNMEVIERLKQQI